jgi:CheY-like chemotaxis protein
VDSKETPVAVNNVVLLIEDAQPDAVVLDIRLPGMDGWDVVRQLRAGGRFLTIPVVVFSAYANESSASDFGCAYLPKPFHPEELTTTLRTALGHEDG